MAIEPTELFGTLVTQTPLKRAMAREAGIRIGKLAPIVGAPILKHLTALAWDGASERWVPFDRTSFVDEVYNIGAASTPASAGSFTLTLVSFEDEDGVVVLSGETTPAIVFNALPAAVVTALSQISQLNGDITAVMTTGVDLGIGSAVMRIDFSDGNTGRAIVLSADFTGLTGNVHVLSNPIEG